MRDDDQANDGLDLERANLRAASEFDRPDAKPEGFRNRLGTGEGTPRIVNDMKPVSVRKPYREPDPNMMDIEYSAANHFLADVGLPLTPDAVEQLVHAFLPALKIICERGYHPEGNTWREAGWRGVLTDIRKKSNRLHYRAWIKGNFDEDSARDLINFAGFYLRLRNKGPEWGTWGNPGGRKDPMGREADYG